MAKQLKINIKNVQLAEALKKAKKEEKQEPPKEKQVAPSERATPDKEKRIVRARKEPSTAMPAPPKKEEAKKEEPAPPPVELPPVVALPPEPPKPPAPEPAKPAPPVAKEEEEEKAAAKAAKKPEKKKGVGEKKEEHDDKQKKAGGGGGPPSHKRQAFSRVFDSRDKTGIRTGGDDETWRRRRQKGQKLQKQAIPIVRPTEVRVKLPITVKELAADMKVKASDVIQKLFLQGLPITINDLLDDPTTIELIGQEFGCQIAIDTTREERLQVTGRTIDEEVAETDPSKLVIRPPVVTIMGHVDHGKTSIIDAFRQSNLTAGEAGAITQHIGAFKVFTKHGSFTVLDTPGHEAFAAIRSRGAHVTDIVVLVVAGDEGIMPQTLEAIEKAREAGVPIIVAINKMDKPGFNTENVYRQLADNSLLPEAWGGEIITVNCSAKTKEGIDHLAEMIALQSEILELKANPHIRARGVVLESELHRGLGASATLLIQNGTLREGDALLFEYEYGRVKAMQDERGKKMSEAPPSSAVKVTGLSGVPSAGNVFVVLENEKEARKIAEERKASSKKLQLRQTRGKDLEHMFAKSAEQQKKKTLNIILKADVGGSVEALKNTILKIPTDKVQLNFITADVGQISESDIELAEASNAIILGFHTNIESHAEKLIKMKKITIFLRDIIYDLVDDVKKHMVSLLDKLREETEVGSAVVLAVFKSSHLGLIAGCKVLDGSIKRSHFIKIFRDGEEIWKGAVSSLKRHQDDVKEVKKDQECGILLEGFKDVKENDLIRSYEISYKTQEL